MEFGQVADPRRVSFQFPPEPVSNSHVLAGHPVAQSKLYLGLTGWSEKAWLGQIYPRGTTPAQFLAAYGRVYDSVELNSTFYRIPSDDLIDRWRKAVPVGFRFCPKVHQGISHQPDLGLNSGLAQEFIEQMHRFGEALGAAFLQLPPWFSRDRIPRLARFLDLWPVSAPLYLEPRHPDLLMADEFLELLELPQLGLVQTDVAGHREFVHLRLDQSGTIIRFVACGEREIDLQRLINWAHKLQDWFAQGLQTAYFFCHQPDNRLAPGLADAFQKVVEGLTGPDLPLELPERVRLVTQKSLFDEE